MKTSKLTGPALDWAVAKCEAPVGGYKAWVQADLDKGLLHGMCYSSDWLWGGPIIEREKITLEWTGEDWMGYIWHDAEFFGPTPLIAAMRCYVAGKLGDDVNVPDGLAE